jgi:hypothetical protein
VNDVLVMLNDLLALGIELIEAVTAEAARAIRTITRQLRNAARWALLWPFILMAVAIPDYHAAQYAVPIVTILALVPLLWTLTAQLPISILVGEIALSIRAPYIGQFVAKAREITNKIRLIVGLELILGIYLSIVPVSNDRRLALVLILVFAAIVCFVEINKKVVIALTVVVVIITLVFFLGGRDNIRKVLAEHKQTDDDSSNKKSPAGRPIVIEQPLASGRQHDPETPQSQQTENAGLKPDPPYVPKPPMEIKPLSGDEGIIRVRMLGPCQYLHAGEAVCKGYFENLEGGALNPMIYLDDSEGVDDSGTGFNVWLSDGSIKFVGGGYREILIPGMKCAFVVTIRKRSGIQAIGLNLKYNDGHAHWFESDFANVPVAAN